MSKNSQIFIRLTATLAVLVLSACGSNSNKGPASSISNASQGSQGTPSGQLAVAAPETPVIPVAGTPVVQEPAKDCMKDSKDSKECPAKDSPKDWGGKDCKDGKDCAITKEPKKDDIVTAYNRLVALKCDTVLTGQDLGGQTLRAGTYCFMSPAQLTGTLTLDAQGISGAAFVFQFASTLTTSSEASVRLINGGSECNVFWQAGDSVTLGTQTKFLGNILALNSVTVNPGSSIKGQVFAQKGTVVMDSSALSNSACSLDTIANLAGDKAGKDGKDDQAAKEPCTDKDGKDCSMPQKGKDEGKDTGKDGDKKDAISAAPLADASPSPCVDKDGKEGKDCSEPQKGKDDGKDSGKKDTSSAAPLADQSPTPCVGKDGKEGKDCSEPQKGKDDGKDWVKK